MGTDGAAFDSDHAIESCRPRLHGSVIYHHNALDISFNSGVACPNSNGAEGNMKKAGTFGLLSTVVFLGLVCVLPSAAQLFPGRITGTVRDTQGAVVAGATV